MEIVVAEGMRAEVVFTEVASAKQTRILLKNHGRLADSFHGFAEWDALSRAFCMREILSGTGLSRLIRAG